MRSGNAGRVARDGRQRCNVTQVATAENDSARATGQRLGRLVQEMAPVVAIIDDMRCRRADKERAAALVSGRLKTRRHRIVAVESETVSGDPFHGG